ncbi:MAG TPA: thiol reductant ABC exporter subunit CydD [Propionibacteriaceae bacterium]|nr:thiol reductant ABC exporter subunit CydD [Propionibacteriaceae bacterium]
MPGRSARGPVDPRLLSRARATRLFLGAGVAAGTATAVLVIVQAALLAGTISSFAGGSRPVGLGTSLALLVAVLLGRAALTWLTTWLAHRSAAAVKSQLRHDVMSATLQAPGRTPSATLVTLMTQGLDGLDGYYAKYLPQLVLAVTVPLFVGVSILVSDWSSALIIAVTVPLIPLFMAMVGWTTEARVRRRYRYQTRLARHFADLVAGLPTLQVFGRAKAQAEGLRRTEEANRAETLATLRISFLSALVLELLSTLSVAIVAVTVGTRLVYYGIDFRTALFVLILAPEVYLPIRQVGVHYHDSADGVAAAEAAFVEIDRLTAPVGGSAVGEGPLVVDAVTHSYGEVVALSPTSFTLSPGEVVALSGPSGSGKSTLLSALLGFLTPTGGSVTVGGVGPADADGRAWRRRFAYVPQQPGMVVGTVADNVRLADPGADDMEVAEVLAAAGAPDLALDHLVGDEAEGLSAGERRRVGIARALLRIRRGADVLVLDEPTAGLDADSEAIVVETLRGSGASALVVSHRPAVLAAADRVVRVGASA